MEAAVVISAIATAILALLAAVGAWFNWRQVRAVERQVAAQTDPLVTVRLVQLQSGSNHFALVLENHGKTPAFNVKCVVRPSRETVGVSTLRQFVQEKLGILRPVMVPGQVAAWIVEPGPVFDARNAGCQIEVELNYSKLFNGPSNVMALSRIAPTWSDGELLLPPGLWRELDSFTRQAKGQLEKLTKTVERLASDRTTV